jgi:spore maturation protein CgeB
VSHLVISKIREHLNRVMLKNKTPQLLEPISDSELAKYYIDFEQQKKRIRSHLQKVGKHILPNKKPRIYAAVHNVNWELDNLVTPWSELGHIEHYDWGETYDQYDPQWNENKRFFCNELLEKVRIAHQREPIDIFFSYLSGNWIYPDLITEINKLGIVTINFSFDDKLKFWGFQTEHGLTGNADIAPAFDICITCQSSDDVSKYVYVGGNPLFFPPAANPNTFDYKDTTKDIGISFIGQKYGQRSKVFDALLKRGVPISIYGKGWPSGELSFMEKIDVLSRTQINLGFGYIDNSDNIVGLKERDFEVPLMGGLYITTYNPDLEACYILGHEIECYKDFSELVEKTKYYLSHPEEAKRKGLAGRNRVLGDHTWKRRFGMVIDLLSKETV